MKTSLLLRSNGLLRGVSQILPPTHIRFGLIGDSIAQDENGQIVELSHCFLSCLFRRDGKKHGKNGDQGVPELY